MSILGKFLPLLFLPIFFQCDRPEVASASLENPKQFSEYWDSGLAEIATYDLSQARYGKIHKGTATLIFVHEGFSGKKQVKSNSPVDPSGDVIPVLKLNMTKDFLTGVYPYKLMLSVFTPRASSPSSIKEVASIQEWCGTTFLQMNRKGNGYDFVSYSYFESEGDKKGRIENTILEDELWNRIRLAPEKLPQGKIRIFPSAFYLRFSHRDLASVFAEAKIEPVDTRTNRYIIRNLGWDRTLKIEFESAFPHHILGWEEEYPDSDFLSPAQKLITKATRRGLARMAYWEKHSPVDRSLRSELHLSTNE